MQDEYTREQPVAYPCLVTSDFFLFLFPTKKKEEENKNSENFQFRRGKKERRERVFSSNHGALRVPHSLIKLPAVFIERTAHDSVITAYLTRYS